MIEGLPTVRETVHTLGLDPESEDLLVTALMAREDIMVSALHMAGIQFGMMPGIVAEVLASIGIGTPPTDDERLLIRRNFIDTINSLREQD